MSPAAVRISSATPFAAPVSANPSDQQRRGLEVGGQRGQRAADRGRDVAARDHRHPADAVHQPPGRHRGQRRGDEEDRRPEPEQPVDAGDEHERDRGHRRHELQHRRVDRHRDREQDRVAADREVHAISAARSRRGPWRPRWRSAARGRRGRAPPARRAPRTAPRRTRRSSGPNPASARIAACVSLVGDRDRRRRCRAAATATRPRETTAQSSPAIAVPGVGISTGSPASSAAVRHAATSGSTPTTGTPTLGP